MIAIKARVRNGYLVSVDPVNLPEGAEFEVTADPQAMPDERMTEDNWPLTPQGIAALLARMDSREPLRMSDSEIEKWNRGRTEDRERELSQADARHERLRMNWE